ncbi:hypothetical protein PMAYCL1PPCAC_14758, partial [Pristionchus mayeri]
QNEREGDSTSQAEEAEDGGLRGEEEVPGRRHRGRQSGGSQGGQRLRDPLVGEARDVPNEEQEGPRGLPTRYPPPVPAQPARLPAEPSWPSPGVRAHGGERAHRDLAAVQTSPHLRPILRTHGPVAVQTRDPIGRQLAETTQGDQEPGERPSAHRLQEAAHLIRRRETHRLLEDRRPGGGGSHRHRHRRHREGKDRDGLHGRGDQDLQLPAVCRAHLRQDHFRTRGGLGRSLNYR